MKFFATTFNLPHLMKIRLTFIVLMYCLTTSVQAEILNVKDSIGVEVINGQTFVLHKVEAKETLYSLSRRYNASIEEIVKHNPEAEAGLKVESVLKIPYSSSVTKQTAKNTHTVAPGQTLYAISQMHGIPVADIKKWNNLNSNDLNVGQTLVLAASTNNDRLQSAQPAKSNANNNAVSDDPKNPSSKVVHKVEPSQTLFSISKMYNVAVEDIIKWNNLEGNALDVGQQLTIRVKREANKFDEAEQIPVITEEVAQEKVVRLDNKVEPETSTPPLAVESPAEKAETKKTNSSGFKKIVELGLAEVIEHASDTKKYVALHRTAPIGTIMQVTNEMNNQNVFVRVIGKLPDTGANDKVLIKLSRPAFERLGAVNDKFPAEISYVP